MFEFFPFDMESGPLFLAFYFVFSVATLFIAKRIRKARIAAKYAEPPEPAALPEPRAPVTAYRTAVAPARAHHRRLTIGYAPGPDEVWAVSYLREGATGVANTIVAIAGAAGWLTPRGATSYVFTPPASTPAPAIGAFVAELKAKAPTGVTNANDVRVAASSAAASVAASLDLELDDAGLARIVPDADQARIIEHLAIALNLVVGVVRLVRGALLGHPILFLVIEILGFLLYGRASAKRAYPNPRVTAYLKWLEDASYSLRVDVAGGRRRDVVDVALAAAIAGPMAVGVMAAFQPAYVIPPPPIVTSTSTWGSSSSGS
jgi:uncharacterized protein (TIGR04222 family)